MLTTELFENRWFRNLLNQTCIAKNQSALQLLIADDSVEVRQSLRKLLQPIEGLEIVAEAGNARETLEKFRQQQPQVVLMDVKMPGGNGLDIAKIIKQERPACIVIIFTNFASEEFRRIARQNGADYFFDKSAEFEQVVQIIEEQSRQQRR